MGTNLLLGLLPQLQPRLYKPNEHRRRGLAFGLTHLFEPLVQAGRDWGMVDLVLFEEDKD